MRCFLPDLRRLYFWSGWLKQMKKNLTIISDSAQTTKNIGAMLARELSKTFFGKGAAIVALKGDLGAGKTTFVLGFLEYFGIKPHAASPTFVIMKRYKINSKLKIKNSKTESIYHLDAYRLHSKKDLDVLGFNEILNNPQNIILVEWPERIKRARFRNKIGIEFYYGKEENERRIIFGKK